MSGSNRLRCDYTVVEPNRRLASRTWSTSCPAWRRTGPRPRIELTRRRWRHPPRATNDFMHSELWTERARMGWEQELGKLERALA